jgi:hypothetical protein
MLLDFWMVCKPFAGFLDYLQMLLDLWTIWKFFGHSRRKIKKQCEVCCNIPHESYPIHWSSFAEIFYLSRSKAFLGNFMSVPVRELQPTFSLAKLYCVKRIRTSLYKIKHSLSSTACVYVSKFKRWICNVKKCYKFLCFNNSKQLIAVNTQMPRGFFPWLCRYIDFRHYCQALEMMIFVIIHSFTVKCQNILTLNKSDW